MSSAGSSANFFPGLPIQRAQHAEARPSAKAMLQGQMMRAHGEQQELSFTDVATLNVEHTSDFPDTLMFGHCYRQEEEEWANMLTVLACSVEPLVLE
jgi:hypothetical protein